MFAQAIRNAARTSGRRAFSTEPKRQSSFMERWILKKEAWPIFIVIGGACALGAAKLWHDANAPDTHFNKKERMTLDYVENDRDPKKAAAWGESTWHKGPKAGK